MRYAAGDASGECAPKAQPEPTPPKRWIDPRYETGGVDLVGDVRAELGLGESVRSFARSLAGAGYPFCLLDLGIDLPGRQQDRSMDAWIEQPPRHAMRLSFVNPDRLHLVARHWPQFSGYRIAYWFWELERFPQEWTAACDDVDEIWVASEFVRASIAAATRKPVMLMPKAIAFDPPPEISREHFGLPDDAFVFLFNFDFHSYPERKNPGAVIAAFREAFPRSRHDVQLIIKTTNGDRMETGYERLVIEASRDPRISIRDGYVSRAQMYALLACADAYVSLHRAEGFGLGMAEAMYLGKPVIATAYSGNMDFMSENEACLISYRMIDVPPDAYPHWHGQHWAEPDILQAARAMRCLADDPAAAATLGAAAAARIRRQYARSVCAAAVIGRLQTITAARGAAEPNPARISPP